LEKRQAYYNQFIRELISYSEFQRKPLTEGTPDRVCSQPAWLEMMDKEFAVLVGLQMWQKGFWVYRMIRKNDKE